MNTINTLITNITNVCLSATPFGRPWTPSDN